MFVCLVWLNAECWMLIAEWFGRVTQHYCLFLFRAPPWFCRRHAFYHVAGLCDVWSYQLPNEFWDLKSEYSRLNVGQAVNPCPERLFPWHINQHMEVYPHVEWSLDPGSLVDPFDEGLSIMLGANRWIFSFRQEQDHDGDGDGWDLFVDVWI